MTHLAKIDIIILSILFSICIACILWIGINILRGK